MFLEVYENTGIDLSAESSDFGSGYIQLAGDGSVKQINYPSGSCS